MQSDWSQMHSKYQQQPLQTLPAKSPSPAAAFDINGALYPRLTLARAHAQPPSRAAPRSARRVQTGLWHSRRLSEPTANGYVTVRVVTSPVDGVPTSPDFSVAVAQMLANAPPLSLSQVQTLGGT